MKKLTFLMLFIAITTSLFSQEKTWQNKSIALGIGQPYGIAGVKTEMTTFSQNVIFEAGAGYNFVDDIVFNFGVVYNKNIASWLDLNAGVMYGANQVLEVSTIDGNKSVTSYGASLHIGWDILLSNHIAIEIGNAIILTRSNDYKNLLSLTNTKPSDITLQLGVKYNF